MSHITSKRTAEQIAVDLDRVGALQSFDGLLPEAAARLREQEAEIARLKADRERLRGFVEAVEKADQKYRDERANADPSADAHGVVGNDDFGGAVGCAHARIDLADAVLGQQGS